MPIADQRAKRVLTTHVGSLPRPAALSELMVARMDKRGVDEGAFNAAVRKAVVDRVAWQADLGVDVVSDGEQSKTGFFAYVHERAYAAPGGFQKWLGERAEKLRAEGKDVRLW